MTKRFANVRTRTELPTLSHSCDCASQSGSYALLASPRKIMTVLCFDYPALSLRACRRFFVSLFANLLIAGLSELVLFTKTLSMVNCIALNTLQTPHLGPNHVRKIIVLFGDIAPGNAPIQLQLQPSKSSDGPTSNMDLQQP